MIDPAELVDALVDNLRMIPHLVMEMDGDVDRIYTYHDSYPKSVSLAHAIHAMPLPAIMAAWNGSGPAQSGDFTRWRHNVTLYLRAKNEIEGDPRAGYYRLFRLIVKGIPTGQSQPMLYLDIHPSCTSMEVPMIERQTDAEALDYFQVPITFTEIGDD